MKFYAEKEAKMVTMAFWTSSKGRSDHELLVKSALQSAYAAGRADAFEESANICDAEAEHVGTARFYYAVRCSNLIRAKAKESSDE